MPSTPPPAQPRPRRRGAALLRRVLPCLLAALAAACDDGFSPVEESGVGFSVYGYLDASADTQWVRVMPLRLVALTSPEPLGARVTLEDVATGRVIELRDSVFRFVPTGPDVGSEGVFVHNYWTTERLEPGASYRFSATRAGGPPAEAVVRIPSDFEMTEVWLRQPRTGTSDVVPVAGPKHVPFTGVVNHYFDGCGAGVERVYAPAAPVDPGGRLVPITGGFRGRPGCEQPVIEAREVVVVGSEDEWPEGAEYRPGRLGLDEVPSNVSNALGFLGGVLTKRLPYERCDLESTPPSGDYCRLRYDAASATLRGVLRDTLCASLPVVGATVRLSELDAPPGAPRKIRSVRSDHLGRYVIGALEAGRRYALSVRRTVGQIEVYQEHTDTLTLAPGEQATHDAGLRSLLRCGEQP